MKKSLTLLILLLSIHSLKRVKIESFDDLNWQAVLMETIRDPHMGMDVRIGWIAAALVYGADYTIDDYAPVREAIRRGQSCLLVTFFQAGLPLNLVIDGHEIREHLETWFDDPRACDFIIFRMLTHTKKFQIRIPSDVPFFQERLLLFVQAAIKYHNMRIDHEALISIINCDGFLAIKYLLDSGFISANHIIDGSSVSYLLSPSRDHNNISILYLALTLNANNIMKLLLSHEAHIDIEKSRAKQIEIILDIVALKLYQDPHHIVQHLLYHRYISPNSVVTHPRTNVNQPLIVHCAQFNAVRCIRLLAAHGANLAPAEYPQSALQVAADGNCLEATQALMELGAYGLTPHAKLPIHLIRYIHRIRSGTHRSITYYSPWRAAPYLANFRRASLLLNAYIQQNNIARYLPVITNSLFSRDRRYYDSQHQLAQLILEYSQGIPLQKYKAPAPVKVTTLVHVPKKSAKRRYADIHVEDQPAPGAADAHLSASAQSEIANRARR